jgi:hypothetical protein
VDILSLVGKVDIPHIAALLYGEYKFKASTEFLDSFVSRVQSFLSNRHDVPPF